MSCVGSAKSRKRQVEPFELSERSNARGVDQPRVCAWVRKIILYRYFPCKKDEALPHYYPQLVNLP